LHGIDVRKVRHIIQKHFEHLAEVRPGVVRAMFAPRGRTAALCFFDCSEAFLSIGDRFGDYQRDLLGRDYYSNAGSLQWNLYLYLLCTELDYDRLVREGVTDMIEEDDLYARKLVTTDDRLEKDILPALHQRVRPSLKGLEDISQRWMTRLREAQLAGVYAPGEPMDRVVTRYLEGNPILEPSEEVARGTAVRLPHLGFIERISLDQYRPCLSGRTFPLGPVNLITGQNGAGKTSLLEAIELWFCGRTLRGGPEESEQYTIGVQFAGDRGMATSSGESESTFRARALAWYGIHKARKNLMPEAFGRFNFYDTDAATRLAESAGEKEMRDAVASLVLGERASIIEERLGGVGVRFEKEREALSRECSLLAKQIDEVDAEVSALGGVVDCADVLQERLSSTLLELGWKEVSPTIPHQASDLQVELEYLSARLSAAQKEVFWVPAANLRELRLELETLTRLDSKVQQLTDQRTRLKNDAAQLQAAVGSATDVLRRLDQLAGYYSDPVAEQLPGLAKRITDEESALTRIQVALSQVEGIDLGRYKDMPEDLAQLQGDLRGSLETEQDAQAHLGRELEKAAQSADRRMQLTQELCADGLELLHLSEQPGVCPLCGAQYSLSELAQRVAQRAAAATRASASYQHLRSQLAATQAAVAGTREKLSDLSRLQAVASSLEQRSSSARSAPVRSVVSQVIQARADAATRARELDQLRMRQQLLANRGLTEERLRELTEWFDTTYGASDKYRTLHNDPAALRAEMKTRIDEQSRQLLSADRELSDVAAKRARLLKKYFARRGEAPGLPDEVQRRRRILGAACALVGELDKRLSVSPDMTIGDLVARLATLASLCERYRTQLDGLDSAAVRRRTLNAKRSDVVNRYRAAHERKDRSDAALEAIHEIAHGEDSKEQRIRSFFDRNLDEVSSLFCVLCAPREFTGVAFDDRTGLLVVIRRGSRTESPIRRISSGQRSALALSIFLTLNGHLKSGPPFLLLDDPAAHVDDLNTLSFLDWLRMCAVGGKRQVFFATASTKVARLFRSKFDFLGEEVVNEVCLSRAAKDWPPASNEPPAT
jgi:DNA repair exonuclease SbcCD ATPase subunit